MSIQENRGQPLWVILVLALLTSTVPSYMSYLASKQTIDERGKDVGVASVDQTRAILEPAIIDLNRRLGELSGRLEIIQASTGAGAVAVVPKTRTPSSSAAAPPTPATATPSTDTDTGVETSVRRPTAKTLPAQSVLPKRAQLTPDQLRIRQEISKTLTY